MNGKQQLQIEHSMKSQRSTSWAFTINGDFEREDYDQMFENNDNVTYIIVGVEKGKENGKWHAQGFLQMAKTQAMSYVKALFITNPHLERMRASVAANIRYCTKDDKDAKSWGEVKLAGGNRGGSGRKRKHEEILEDIDEPDIETFKKGGTTRIAEKRAGRILLRNEKMRVAREKELENFEFNAEQKRWWKSLTEQNNRQITWVFDREGGTGKSTFTKWLRFKKGALFVISGKSADMMQILYNQLADGNMGEYCVIDLVRSQDLVFNYTVLEQVKDGIIAKTKYNSSIIDLENVKVIVMANFAPNQEAMTADRWTVLTPILNL